MAKLLTARSAIAWLPMVLWLSVVMTLLPLSIFDVGADGTRNGSLSRSEQLQLVRTAHLIETPGQLVLLLARTNADYFHEHLRPGYFWQLLGLYLIASFLGWCALLSLIVVAGLAMSRVVKRANARQRPRERSASPREAKT